jgi:prevent-host-death family protein
MTIFMKGGVSVPSALPTGRWAMEEFVREVGAFEARNQLGQLLDLVQQGEEINITRHAKEVARLVPVLPKPSVAPRMRPKSNADPHVIHWWHDTVPDGRHHAGANRAARGR